MRTNNKSNAKRLLLLGMLGAAAVSLSGCQTSCTGDARFDGYLCARGNLSNGTYENQTNLLRQTAYDRQSEAASLRSRYVAAQARLRAARARPSTPPSNIRALENEISSLRRALDRASG